VRAHAPACFWFFAESWHNIFRTGVLDHALKELCGLYVSRSVACEYCGNQRSIKAAKSGGLIEDQVLDLLNFEKSAKYNERQKAALAYARPSFGGSTPTMRSGTACMAISASRSSWNLAA
jgi:alkylhydroperoxidase family enzyme